MGLRLYNTLTRTKEDFKPIDGNNVRLYCCGPTVYNFVHIGNLKTFLFEDVLTRYLKFKGYNVTSVMNLTDVDDKTIRNAKAQGISLNEYTEKYKQAFFNDLKTLNIVPATHYPEATKHINEMVELIKKLSVNGYTYESDGSIYFKIDKFKNYNELAKLDEKKLRSGASGRTTLDEYEKENVSDFVLWKAYTPEDGDVFWDTELGKGRPGWHLECSAMSMKYLGETLDIHCGAVDLIFPHHTNEIAQSEGATGKKFVNYWIHGEFVNMVKEDGTSEDKMSKKLGNIVYLKDLLDKNYKREAIRYFCISSSYRMPLTFREENIKQAESTLERIQDFIHRCQNVKPDKTSSDNISQIASNILPRFEENMDDDLNISGALGSLFEAIKSINIIFDEVGYDNAQELIRILKRIDEVIGVLTFEKEILDDDIQNLINERTEARKSKNFKRSDEIRDLLLKQNIVLEDTKDGTIWKRV